MGGELWQPIYVIVVRLLLYDMPSSSTVQVEGRVAEGWVMDLGACEACMRETSLLHHLQVGTYIMYLQRVLLFRKIKTTDPRLKTLIMASQPLELWNEEDIIVQGEHGDCMFILMEGLVNIWVNDKQVAQQLADLDHDKVHFFGELSIIDQGPRLATVKVASASVTVLKVDLHAVNTAFGSLQELLEEQGLDMTSALEMSKSKVRTKYVDKGEAKATVAQKSKYDGKWEKKYGIATDTRKIDNQDKPKSKAAEKWEQEQQKKKKGQ